MPHLAHFWTAARRVAPIAAWSLTALAVLPASGCFDRTYHAFIVLGQFEKARAEDPVTIDGREVGFVKDVITRPDGARMIRIVCPDHETVAAKMRAGIVRRLGINGRIELDAKAVRRTSRELERGVVIPVNAAEGYPIHREESVPPAVLIGILGLAALLLLLFLKYVFSGVLPAVCLALALITGSIAAPALGPAIQGFCNPATPPARADARPGGGGEGGFENRVRLLVREHTTPWTVSFVLVSSGAFLIYAGVLETIARHRR